jgi:hypothetical protein
MNQEKYIGMDVHDVTVWKYGGEGGIRTLSPVDPLPKWTNLQLHSGLCVSKPRAITNFRRVTQSQLWSVRGEQRSVRL